MNEENESLLIERELRQANDQAYATALQSEEEEMPTVEEQAENLEAELKAMTGGIIRITEAKTAQEAKEQWNASLHKEELEEQEEAETRKLVEAAKDAETAEAGMVRKAAQSTINNSLANAENTEMGQARTSFQAYAAAEAELQTIEEENQELLNSVTVIISEEKTAAISEDRYNELVATELENKKCRYIGVEQFRLWAQGLHPEVVTVQDALRACNVEELKKWLNEFAPVKYGSNAVSTGLTLFNELATRLKHRAELRAEAQAKISEMKVVEPDA